MKRKISNVTLVGAGFMARQIAARAAVHGSRVCLYDKSGEALEKAEADVHAQIKNYFAFGQASGDPGEAVGRVLFNDNLAGALEAAELVIEIVPEDLALKREVFGNIDAAAPGDAIIATNSSSIPVSRLESSVKRGDKVMNIHFYVPVATNNFVDIMRGSMTGEDTFERSKEWVEGIGCVPLVVMKECMGFVFNRIWHAVKKEALATWGGGHADFRDIDRAWMIWTGMIAGPFGMMDVVGLDVVYDIEMQYYRESAREGDLPPQALKHMIDQGDLGLKSGRGFYDWKDPEFARPGFIPKK